MSDEQERLVRIETKLDMLLSDDKDKEERIRKLEAQSAKLFGISGFIAAVIPLALKFLFKI